MNLAVVKFFLRYLIGALTASQVAASQRIVSDYLIIPGWADPGILLPHRGQALKSNSWTLAAGVPRLSCGRTY